MITESEGLSLELETSEPFAVGDRSLEPFFFPRPALRNLFLLSALKFFCYESRFKFCGFSVFFRLLLLSIRLLLTPVAGTWVCTWFLHRKKTLFPPVIIFPALILSNIWTLAVVAVYPPLVRVFSPVNFFDSPLREEVLEILSLMRPSPLQLFLLFV